MPSLSTLDTAASSVSPCWGQVNSPSQLLLGELVAPRELQEKEGLVDWVDASLLVLLLLQQLPRLLYLSSLWVVSIALFHLNLLLLLQLLFLIWSSLVSIVPFPFPLLLFSFARSLQAFVFPFLQPVSWDASLQLLQPCVLRFHHFAFWRKVFPFRLSSTLPVRRDFWILTVYQDWLCQVSTLYFVPSSLSVHSVFVRSSCVLSPWSSQPTSLSYSVVERRTWAMRDARLVLDLPLWSFNVVFSKYQKKS